MFKEKILIIGAGAVASHLAPALIKAGHCIVQVMSRSHSSAVDLAKSLDVFGCDMSGKFPGDITMVLLTVSDSSIPNVISTIPKGPWLVVHTSGSVSMSVFGNPMYLHGVLYPLQTFTEGRELDVCSVPFFVEGSSEEAETRLMNIASQISGTVSLMDSESRALLHTAAVFANNFTNFCTVQALDLLNKTGTDSSVLKPLIEETFRKMIDIGAVKAQTGPAKRGDKETLKKHLDLLSCCPEKQSIYQLISSAIEYYFNTRES